MKKRILILSVVLLSLAVIVSFLYYLSIRHSPDTDEVFEPQIVNESSHSDILPKDEITDDNTILQAESDALNVNIDAEQSEIDVDTSENGKNEESTEPNQDPISQYLLPKDEVE